jgi:hypothetical protein
MYYGHGRPFDSRLSFVRLEVLGVFHPLILYKTYTSSRLITKHAERSTLHVSTIVILTLLAI